MIPGEGAVEQGGDGGGGVAGVAVGVLDAAAFLGKGGQMGGDGSATGGLPQDVEAGALQHDQQDVPSGYGRKSGQPVRCGALPFEIASVAIFVDAVSRPVQGAGVDGGVQGGRIGGE